MSERRSRHVRRRAFTLVELLIVIGIIAVLIGLLLPALARARAQSKRTHCLSNLHQVGIALHGYASDYEGRIPYGPKDPPAYPGNFYQRTGWVTSLLSYNDQLTGRTEMVGLGLMLHTYLGKNPKVLFCPATDQQDLSDFWLEQVGIGQAQCDYYYRHGSFAERTPAPEIGPIHINLANLGRNSRGDKIRALVMDVDFETIPELAPMFGIGTRTCHDRRTVSVLYADGHAAPVDNTRRDFTVDAKSDIQNALRRILENFEKADVFNQ
jgi:prepilin-type N-terminal cleavage/methylation domain-containing protein/prepilin-type processing-associated H-X9-DG protein